MSDCTHPAEAVTPMDAGEGFCAECQKAVLVGGNSDRPAPKSIAPVGLASLLRAVLAYIRRYVILSGAQAIAVTLWVAHTHAFDAAEATPYLAITSAEKKSGKTRLLELLEWIVARVWATAHVTPAVLYRKIEAECSTLLLDESDAAFKGDKDYAQALRGILNSGHRRGGKVSACVGQGANMTYRDFSTFCPKAIAGLAGLPDTVQDRSIAIVLKRKGPTEKVARFRQRKVEKEAVPLKEGLAAWVTTSAALVEAEPKLPEALDDRAQDSWEVLLAIADMAGGEWPHWARCAAVTLSVGDAREDESLGIKLLLDIRDIFADLGDDRITTANLIKALIRLEESPWADLEGKVLNPRRLGWRLKPFSIRSGTIRLSDTVTVKGYLKEAFEPEWARYLPPLPQAKPSQAEKPSQVAGTDIDTDTDNVTVSRDVTVSQGVGKEDDNGQRLHALSLWEQLGRPAKPTLRDGIKIIDVERFIDNANAADLTAFITGLEGTA